MITVWYWNEDNKAWEWIYDGNSHVEAYAIALKYHFNGFLVSIDE